MVDVEDASWAEAPDEEQGWKLLILTGAASPRRGAAFLTPGLVVLDDVVLLRPQDVQTHAVLAHAIPLIVVLHPRFREVLQLFTGVVISPDTLLHFSVFRPMNPWFTYRCHFTLSTTWFDDIENWILN